MAVKLGNGNWAVKEDKLLAYNDNSGLFFNKEFDFSRGTSATYVAKDGLIKTAGIQPNVVSNGDFATDSDWTKGTGWTIADGSASYDASGTSALTSASTSIVSGKIYRLKFKITTSGFARLNFTTDGSQSLFQPNGNSLNNFADGEYTFYLSAQNNSTALKIFAYNVSGGTSFLIDNVSVQEIQTDTPRIDFTNDTKGHLLLEPQSTNLIPYSEDFSQWSLLGGTAGTVTYVSDLVNPDGSVGGYKISNSGIFVGIGLPSTAQRSIYARSVSGSGNAQLMSHNSNTNNVFTLTEEWQRFELNSSPLVAGNFYVDLRGSETTLDEIYVWGANATNDQDYLTSYIPTTGAASTRNADVCNNSGSAQDFNSEEGVLYAEVASLAEDIGGSKNFSISDGTNNNGVKFAFRTAGSQIGVSVKSNGTTTANNVYNMPVSNFFKVAFKYKTNDCALWVNGTEIATDTSAAMPLDLSSLRFDRGDNGNKFNGKVRNLQVFTEALTDEQLQKLTS